MQKSPTPIPPDTAALDLGRQKKLALVKGLNLSGMLMFGAPGIVTHMSADGELKPVEQAPKKSESN